MRGRDICMNKYRDRWHLYNTTSYRQIFIVISVQYFYRANFTEETFIFCYFLYVRML